MQAMTILTSVTTFFVAASMTILGTAAFAGDIKTNHSDTGAAADMDHGEHAMVADMPDGLALGHPVVLVASRAAKSAAAFMVIENTADTDERLVAVRADFARTIQMHRHIIEDDVAKMREVESGFAIKAGGTHALQRGGDHLMIMGLETVPVIGDTVMITLTFETAGDVTVPFAVMDATTAGEMDHGKMDHGKTGHSQMKSDN